MESAQEYLGNEDPFTKKIAQLVESPKTEDLAAQDASNKSESFPFSTSNTEEIRDHIEKLIRKQL